MTKVLFSTSPEDSCLIVSTDIPENELQQIREKFPHHKIVVCCPAHAPSFGVFMAPLKALSNKPPCAVVLTPDDNWKIPEKW